MSLFRNKSETRDAAGWQALRDFSTGGSPLLGSSAKAALTLVPLYSATSLIADSLCILPVHGYRDRRRLNPQPQLCVNPSVNPAFTRAEWLHQFAVCYLLRGNAYGQIMALDNQGVPSKIAWLNPDNVRVEERRGIPVYFYGEKELDSDSIMHIPWYPQPGSVVGLSPIGQFRAQLETGTAAVDYGRNWFKAGSVPSGHLKYGAGKLNPEQSAIVKSRFKAAVAGNDIFVSGNDWDWKALSVKPEEAQFLQTIRAGANQIAAIYKVNPEDIGGEPAASLTYSTVELNQIKFQVRALQPIFTRLEMHMSALLPRKQYVKFNPDAIIRTDLLTRMQAHQIALNTGMETMDEGRALEDKLPMTAAEFTAWQKYKASATPQKQPTQGGA